MLQEKAVVCGLQDQACSPRVTGGSLQVPGCRRKPPLVDCRKHGPDEMKGAPFDAGSRPAVRGLQNEARSFAGCRRRFAVRRLQEEVRSTWAAGVHSQPVEVDSQSAGCIITS